MDKYKPQEFYNNLKPDPIAKVLAQEGKLAYSLPLPQGYNLGNKTVTVGFINPLGNNIEDKGPVLNGNMYIPSINITTGEIVRLPNDKDICDLKGQIDEYYYEMK